jgi:hypothetical protein
LICSYYGCFVGLDAHLLKHTDEDITQRDVAVFVERQVLPMAKPTARRDDRKVGVMVDVGIPHVTAIEHHGVVQQTAAEVYL